MHLNFRYSLKSIVLKFSSHTHIQMYYFYCYAISSHYKLTVYWFGFWFYSTAKAATKIQAVFRGHKVRATMKKSETTSAATSSNNTPASGAAAATENEPTKEELEAEFDPNDKGKSLSRTTQLVYCCMFVRNSWRRHIPIPC